jgi:putative acetyltransferase
MSWTIRLDDLRGPEIAALLQEHLADMHATSPRESVHALDLDQLRQPSIRFYTLWDGETLGGCGALKTHDAAHAEIKSMRVARTHRRQGVGERVLMHLLEVAQAAGVTRVSLETGAQDFFIPARRLYAKHGFAECRPFAGYRPDPNSVFMTRTL